MASFSRTWTFFEDEWHEGNVPIMGPRTHAAWLGSMVFDGARAFEGVTPDLVLHLARVNESAKNFLLKPVVPLDTWLGLVADGLARFDRDAALYIRPMYWAETGAPEMRRSVSMAMRYLTAAGFMTWTATSGPAVCPRTRRAPRAGVSPQTALPCRCTPSPAAR